MNASPSEVWLIEDNSVFRKSIARTLEHFPGFRCTGEFGRCEDALTAMAERKVPGIILLDVGLPGMSGLDGIAKLRALAPSAAVVILTVFEDEDKIVAAICEGAAGYLLKTTTPEELIRALEDVLAGGAPMNGRIARRVLDLFSKIVPRKTDYHLTEREREILQLLTGGFLKKEIADQLSLSVHTVDTHLRNIYGKLQVNSRTSAVAKALRERLL